MSKYAVVGHHYWGRPGGGELVCAATVVALEEVGYLPVLTSPVDFDSGKYVDWFGIDLSKYPKHTWGLKLRAFGLYLRLVSWRAMSSALKKYDADLLFTDVSYVKPLSKLRFEGVKIIEYIHFPFEVSLNPKYSGLGFHYSQDPYIKERYSSFPLNLYLWSFAKFSKYFMCENPFHCVDLVLTNSRWTARVVKEAFGENPIVLNPPIPPNVEVVGVSKPFEERRNLIVMLGRFSEEKRYHWVVSELYPKLKNELPEVKVVIFGGAGTRTAYTYLNKLRELAEKHGVKVSNDLRVDAHIYLIPDAKRETVNKAMDEAKAFLHATINEHWGVAVAEAMARGLPVVVHKSGGAWTDLAEEGTYGLGYQTTEEALKSLVGLFTDGNVWRHYSTKALLRAQNLTLDKYVGNFKNAMSKLLT
ncbi:MAG: glycosyl transferase [Zestosphaera tikiterensis]|uniref:Glycosyl transferase n=2 Tax=Zestosphaera tikiterensis TaxID=1973259 RepID=A0A2R7Y1L6_9CREN|nr:MAG: glycosyl transferase [Zestosphaera tikiterensis]